MGAEAAVLSFLFMCEYLVSDHTCAYLPLFVVVVLFFLRRRARAPPGMTEGATCIFTGAQLLLL